MLLCWFGCAASSCSPPCFVIFKKIVHIPKCCLRSFFLLQFLEIVLVQAVFAIHLDHCCYLLFCLLSLLPSLLLHTHTSARVTFPYTKCTHIFSSFRAALALARPASPCTVVHPWGPLWTLTTSRVPSAGYSENTLFLNFGPCPFGLPVKITHVVSEPFSKCISCSSEHVSKKLPQIIQVEMTHLPLTNPGHPCFLLCQFDQDSLVLHVCFPYVL